MLCVDLIRSRGYILDTVVLLVIHIKSCQQEFLSWITGYMGSFVQQNEAVGTGHTRTSCGVSFSRVLRTNQATSAYSILNDELFAFREKLTASLGWWNIDLL